MPGRALSPSLSTLPDLGFKPTGSSPSSTLPLRTISTLSSAPRATGAEFPADGWPTTSKSSSKGKSRFHRKAHARVWPVVHRPARLQGQLYVAANRSPLGHIGAPPGIHQSCNEKWSWSCEWPGRREPYLSDSQTCRRRCTSSPSCQNCLIESCDRVSKRRTPTPAT